MQTVSSNELEENLSKTISSNQSDGTYNIGKVVNEVIKPQQNVTKQPNIQQPGQHSVFRPPVNQQGGVKQQMNQQSGFQIQTNQPSAVKQMGNQQRMVKPLNQQSGVATMNQGGVRQMNQQGGIKPVNQQSGISQQMTGIKKQVAVRPQGYQQGVKQVTQQGVKQVINQPGIRQQGFQGMARGNQQGGIRQGQKVGVAQRFQGPITQQNQQLIRNVHNNVQNLPNIIQIQTPNQPIQNQRRIVLKTNIPVNTQKAPVNRRIVLKNPSTDAQEPEEEKQENLSSFLSNRKVVEHTTAIPNTTTIGGVDLGQTLLKTPVVTVSNLSAGMTDIKIRKMCQGLGPIQVRLMLNNIN